VTPLAQALIEAAAQALAAGRRAPTSERTLRACHGDAQGVVVAVLARLGGTKAEPGLFSYASTPAQMILSLADEVDESIVESVA
jgi:hypothetical protein